MSTAIQLEAFPPEAVASDSPRLAWLTANKLTTRKETFPRCRLGAPQSSRPWVCANSAMTVCFYGDTELEATQKAAETLGIKHWMQVELEAQTMIEVPVISVAFEEDAGVYVLLATSYGTCSPAGPRLFRADPPEVQFQHVREDWAKRDCAVLQDYLNAVWKKKGKK